MKQIIHTLARNSIKKKMGRTRAECFYLKKVKKKKPIIIIQTNETLNKAPFFHVSI